MAKRKLIYYRMSFLEKEELESGLNFFRDKYIGVYSETQMNYKIDDKVFGPILDFNINQQEKVFKTI